MCIDHTNGQKKVGQYSVNFDSVKIDHKNGQKKVGGFNFQSLFNSYLRLTKSATHLQEK